eukprot:m.251522 g.251522  ORF g.251522 m.251522 type:complete len:960 (-) comp19540_c0_seq1:191-3070(-)
MSSKNTCSGTTRAPSLTPNLDAQGQLQIPEEFPFPFKPYNVQQDFMKCLFSTIENGGMGVFESPTGTGKSMSMICGALAWLKANREREDSRRPAGTARGTDDNSQKIVDAKTMERTPEITHVESVDSSSQDGLGSNTRKEDPDAPDWVKQHVQATADAAREKAMEERRKRDEKYAKLRQAEQYHTNAERHAKRRRVAAASEAAQAAWLEAALEGKDHALTAATPDDTAGDTDDDGSEFLLTDYTSGDDTRDDDASSSEDEDDEKEHITKIIFCSRTHSQLSQFVHEVQASPYGRDTRAVVLGSRQTLCVNDSVMQLKSLSQINDKCRDLQQNKKDDPEKESHKGCPYMHAKRVANFADRALAKVQDVEDLRALGKRTKACPYYGTRKSVAEAEIVAMPYNMLLHRSTREAVGLQLHGNVVLVDEAHNLLPTIESIHSTAVTGSVFDRAVSQLEEYLRRYRKRLNTRNVVYINQILTVLKAMLQFLDDGRKALVLGGKLNKNTSTEVLSVNEFLFRTHTDNINLFRLEKFFKISEISKKVNGFVLKQAAKDVATTIATATPSDDGDGYVSRHVSALRMTESFFAALTNTDKNGRLVVSVGNTRSKCEIKFLLLNPAVYFEDILRETKAVILAGGTMAPMTEFADELLSPAFSARSTGTPGATVSPDPSMLPTSLSDDRAAGTKASSARIDVPISYFSCGHVIPPDNLIACIAAAGPSGKPLNYSYTNRSDPSRGPHLLRDTGQLVLNLCNIIPDGLVVFFPSYAYEEQAYNTWKAAGLTDKFSAKKRVFREPRGGKIPVETILQQYASAITESGGGAGGGALLFSVVGGKMSEGINFKDRLGRGVVVVGLPYPDKNSPELKEKIAFLEQKDGKGGRARGNDYYENICMKAVNQSVGRAIRHSNDYAAIVLADERYSRANIRAKLPAWIQSSLKQESSIGKTIGTLRQFFRNAAAKNSLQP